MPFSSFLAHKTLKKDLWIIPHEAIKIFEWMFLDNCDVLKSEAPQAASKSEWLVFLESPE